MSDDLRARLTALDDTELDGLVLVIREAARGGCGSHQGCLDLVAKKQRDAARRWIRALLADPAPEAARCPSNTVCLGTCDEHSPLRPEHRLPVATGVTTEDERCKECGQTAAMHTRGGRSGLNQWCTPAPAPVVSAGDEGVGRLTPEQIETLLCRCDWGKCALHDEDAFDWIEFRRDELIAVLNRAREIGRAQ